MQATRPGEERPPAEVRDGGLYLLLLSVPRPFRARVGALGLQYLEAGSYVYTGSARKSMRARVARHLRRGKNARWHIDYLTRHRKARPLGALLLPQTALEECTLNRTLTHDRGWTAPIPGFGAGDCRSGCTAHLHFSARSITLAELARHLETEPDTARHPLISLYV